MSKLQINNENAKKDNFSTEEENILYINTTEKKLDGYLKGSVSIGNTKTTLEMNGTEKAITIFIVGIIAVIFIWKYFSFKEKQLDLQGRERIVQECDKLSQTPGYWKLICKGKNFKIEVDKSQITRKEFP